MPRHRKHRHHRSDRRRQAQVKAEPQHGTESPSAKAAATTAGGGAGAAAAAAEATGPQGAHGISAGTQASGAAWGASRPWRPEEGARPKIRPAGKPEAERAQPDPGPQSESYSASEGLPLQVGPEILNRRAALLEQFLLYKYKMKQPMLKADMLKLISPRLEERFPEILKKASERIEKLFAVRVQEVDSVLQAYDLVCELKLPNNGRVRPGRGLPKSGLLMNVLGMIMLKGNCAKEEDIWSLLGTMQIFPGRKHYMYGEPRKLLTQDLVRLQYLEYTPVPDTQPPRYEFRWGRKSYAETTKMRVLQFLAKVNNTVPTAFPAQYQEALLEQAERIRAEGAVAIGLQDPASPTVLLKRILAALSL